MDRAEEVTPPPDLITRIVYHAPQGRIRDGRRISGVFQPAFIQMAAAGSAAALCNGHGDDHLSFAMLGRCTGVQVQQISPADLSPARVWNSVEDKAYRSWDRTVKYYENLRVGYEIETRLQDIRDQQDKMPAPNAATQSGGIERGAAKQGETRQ